MQSYSLQSLRQDGMTQPSSLQVEKRPRWGCGRGAKRFSIHQSLWGKPSKARAEPLATSIHAGPCPLSSPLKNLKNHSSEREILQNVKQKVLSRIEVSVATKISNSCHWPGIINRFPFVFWSIETLSFMIIGVASLFKAHLLVQRRQAHV